MTIKNYSGTLLLLLTLILSICMSCSKDSGLTGSDGQEIDKITEDESGNPDAKVDFTLKSSTDTAHPGEVVTFSIQVERLSEDSLTGAAVKWSSTDLDIEFVPRYGQSTVAFYIPADYSKDELTVTALASAMVKEPGGTRKSKTITVEGDPPPVEEINEYITSDTTFSGDKIYRLTRDIALENGSTLTVTDGATLHLNDFEFVSDNGTIINMKGTEKKQVTLIGGKHTDELSVKSIYADFNSQFAQIITGGNRSIILGKSLIQDSQVFGGLAVSKEATISSSRVSALFTINYHEVHSLDINNSIINLLQINEYLVGELTAQGSTFFMVNYWKTPESVISSFTQNNISYLSIYKSTYDVQLEHNTISRLLVGRSGDIQIQNNNIGLSSNHLYGKNEEPIWIVQDGLNRFNSPYGAVVGLDEYSKDIVLSNNYWAPELLEEMKTKGPESNLSFIYDYNDDPHLGKVIYKDWSETEF